MTAILGLVKGPELALLGDVLVSSTSLGERPSVYVPTLGRIKAREFVLEGRAPAKLVQKLSVLVPELAVAWAGSLIHARRLIVELRAFFSEHVVSQKAVGEWMSKHAQLIDPERSVTLICVIADRAGPRLLSLNASRFDTEQFGIAHVGGSGAGQLLLRLLNGGPDQQPEADIGYLAVWLSADLLTQEIHTSETLELHFGGAYETVLWGGCGFTKGDARTFVLWHAGYDGFKPFLRLPTCVIKQSYHGELLVVRTVKFGFDTPAAASDNYTVIPPADRPQLTAEEAAAIPAPPLKSTHFVHAVVLRMQDGSVQTVTGFEQYLDDQLQLIEEPDRVTIAVPPALVTRLLAGVVRLNLSAARVTA